MKAQRLLKRLDDLGYHLSLREEVLALIGLGSVGDEVERIDRYSDLDFFVVVEDEHKVAYLTDLSWLSEVHPLVYTFKNTKDGHKILFADQIYGEFAVFGRSEIDQTTHAKGRIIYQAHHYDNPRLVEQKGDIPKLKGDNIEYAANEALTNIYVGLLRYHRGEKLSGTRMVEVHALNQIISILHLIDEAETVDVDLFNLERRLEHRYPDFAAKLPTMLAGMQTLYISARHMLDFLKDIYPLNTYMMFECDRLIENLHTTSL